MEKIRISIAMATYNGEKFLKEQLDSILEQLGPRDEIIISDDGSTDGTLRIAESYKDKRIKIINNKKNLGLSLSRNVGIDKSTKEFLYFVDVDDYLEKLKACMLDTKIKCNSDNVTFKMNVTGKTKKGDNNFGTSATHNKGVIKQNDGTVASSAPAGSIVFLPELCIKALEYFYNEVPKLWGKYGLKDAYNLENGEWYANRKCAVTSDG